MFLSSKLYECRFVSKRLYSNDEFNPRSSGGGDQTEARETYEGNYMKILQNPGFGSFPFHCQTESTPSAPKFDPEPHQKSGNSLTHTDSSGKANMVDVGHKDITNRSAMASSRVILGCKAFDLVKTNKMAKGDVLAVAQIAGIMAANNTSNLTPLCHMISLSKVDVTLTLNEEDHSVLITCLTRTAGKTGVEMEALVGASVAALTVYDLCKAVTHDITITDVKLLEKHGGQSGSYVRN